MCQHNLMKSRARLTNPHISEASNREQNRKTDLGEESKYWVSVGNCVEKTGAFVQK